MTRREDGTKEIDRLFSRVDQSPWRARTKVGQLPNEATDHADAIGWPSLLQDESGAQPPSYLINGYLESGPPDEALNIDDDENDLPGWDYVEVQGNWDVSWGADANAPSGNSLDFTQGTAASSDEVYFEQIVPVAAYRRLVTTVRHSADDSNMGMKIAVAFLDEDETIIGSELSNTWSITTEQTSRFWREPPALAMYVRIRVGFVNAAGSTGQTGTILFISLEEPTVYSVDIPGVASFMSPAASTDYDMPYPSDIIPNGVYKADTEGFVLGVSAKTDDTISAGQISARVENDTQATTPGPTVALSSGTTAASARQSLDGASSDSYDFAQDDEMHLELTADGSFSSSGEADYYGSARLLLVVNDHGDWS